MFARNLIKTVLFQNIFKYNLNNYGKRYLFSNEILGLDKFLNTRQAISNNFTDLREQFFGRMIEYTDSDTNLIFTEDLKNVAFLVEDNETELQLLVKMIKKFNGQNDSLRFGSFIFGPVVMRLLHHLNNSDLAVTLIKDKELKSFFSQLSTATILLDMLYKQQKYNEVIDLFNYIKDNIPLENKYPRDCILLMVAACYKLNTKESFDFALKELQAAREVGAKITRKTITMFSALALYQNQPNIALEILSLTLQPNYVTVRNVKLMALSQLKRYADVITMLKIIINRDAPENEVNATILQESMNTIKRDMEATNDSVYLNQLQLVERALIEGNHIQNVSLDSLLTTLVKPLTLNPKIGFANTSLNQNNDRRQRSIRTYASNDINIKRQGLYNKEME